jgi:hypothetical protein
VTELEILRRRRELVLLSAELQRTTLVRRLDHVAKHPAKAILALVTSAASLPLLFKLGTAVFARVGRRNARRGATPSRQGLVSRALRLLRFLPVLKLLPTHRFVPVLKFFTR